MSDVKPGYLGTSTHLHKPKAFLFCPDHWGLWDLQKDQEGLPLLSILWPKKTDTRGRWSRDDPLMNVNRMYTLAVCFTMQEPGWLAGWLAQRQTATSSTGKEVAVCSAGRPGRSSRPHHGSVVCVMWPTVLWTGTVSMKNQSKNRTQKQKQTVLINSSVSFCYIREALGYKCEAG